MSYRNIRNLRYAASLTGIGMLFGITLANIQGGGLNLKSTFHGATDAFMIAGSISLYHMFIFRGLLRESTRRLTFFQVLLLNSLVYLFLLVAGRVAGSFITGHYTSFQDFQTDSYLVESTIFAGIFALVLNFGMQLTDLLGRGELLRFMSGRYHRPRSERRVFLFLDLAGSTTIAEKIGDELFLDLLDRFYTDMSEVIIRTRASIYKYVGDEIIISWTPGDAVRKGACLRFASLFQEIINSRSAYYRERYGLVPEFRGAVHAGTVITGEMGDLKKEIVYMGDVLNTTARVTDLCRSLERPVLATQDALSVFSADGDTPMDTTGLSIQDLGSHQLRGKEDKVRVHSIEFGELK